MALTLDDLRKLFAGEGIERVFSAPDRPALLAGFRGHHGSYQVLTLLDHDGTFLQLRTLDWLRCPATDPAVPALLQAIAHEDYWRRFVKFGWDADSGEVVAYGDVWLEDGTLTQGQFRRILSVYLPVIDLAYDRFNTTIRTGQDPGERRIEDVAGEVLDTEGGGLPDKIRKVLQDIRDGTGGPTPPVGAPPPDQDAEPAEDEEDEFV